MGGKADVSQRCIEPTIILNPAKDSPIMWEEIFGPVLPIITYQNISEVIEHINARPKPLAVYYYGSAYGRNATRICDETSSGAFVCNESLN